MATPAGDGTENPKKPWERLQAKKENAGFRMWLSTLQGRKFVNFTVAGVSATVAVGYVVAHSFAIDKFKEIVQFYRHGFPVDVNPKLNEMKENVLQDMGISDRYRRGFKLFYINGWETFLLGSLKFTNGCRLGLPRTFDYESTNDIERALIEIEGKSVPWQSEDGNLLEQSFVLSDNAKKFAIAQNAAWSQSYWVWANAGLALGSIYGYQLSTVFINDRFLGFHRPFTFRLIVYTVVGSLFYGVWTALKDGYHKRLEMKSNKRAASIGLDFAKGGVEYYAKILQKNIALRSLMGPSGEKLFTPNGNLNYGWLEFRQRVRPYTARKEEMENYVKEYMKQREPNANSNQTT